MFGTSRSISEELPLISRKSLLFVCSISFSRPPSRCAAAPLALCSCPLALCSFPPLIAAAFGPRGMRSRAHERDYGNDAADQPAPMVERPSRARASEKFLLPRVCRAFGFTGAKKRASASFRPYFFGGFALYSFSQNSCCYHAGFCMK